jgi:hypothetical protein
MDLLASFFFMGKPKKSIDIFHGLSIILLGSFYPVATKKPIFVDASSKSRLISECSNVK